MHRRSLSFPTRRASELFISCLYDNSPDEDFVIDRVGPLNVATGFSGHGFKFAPLLGELLADLATGGVPHPRFALPEPVPAT
ncbi:FAD-dependent oxidoreductase [Curtobacterium sp. ME12]|uniref:FAD-dependent oxidoreductase n=1 Tax=Curtobacterium sp. ME12 TaxID=2744253 RepID=UPI0021754801|nr:FAD-dependent oxidoreductase [Curtobacterium sp. ME12]